MTCKFCKFDSDKHGRKPGLNYARCDEHHVEVCPNCWICPTVRVTKKRVALARKRASYKTWSDEVTK